MSEFSESGRDIRAVFQVYHRYAYGSELDPVKAKVLREVGTFIDAWNRNQDCEAAIIDRFIQNLHGADKYREMLAVIRQLAAHGSY